MVWILFLIFVALRFLVIYRPASLRIARCSRGSLAGERFCRGAHRAVLSSLGSLLLPVASYTLSAQDIDTDMEDFSSHEDPIQHRYINMFRTYWYNHNALSEEDLLLVERHLIIPVIQDFLRPCNMRLNSAQELEFLRTLKEYVDTDTLGMRYLLSVLCGKEIGIPLRDSFDEDEQVTIMEEYSCGWGQFEGSKSSWVAGIWEFAEEV
ncbi:hypothetical protein HYFRA_00002278 [Hymenoscyphus fraxineus]|uniref:Uncharacterized protein n=1 Tax=Hymenoscyphus fraxineus TaxID=746836 RepID=A0A9N9Q0H0_9HELO|nr:hypothetical protein HYFRA_00002278 [Hymenoscyphus fraxineus]